MKSYEERRYVYKEGQYTVTRHETIVGGKTSTVYRFESTEDFESFSIPEYSMTQLFNLMDAAMIKE